MHLFDTIGILVLFFIILDLYSFNKFSLLKKIIAITTKHNINTSNQLICPDRPFEKFHLDLDI